jgi:hypothetical protein
MCAIWIFGNFISEEIICSLTLNLQHSQALAANMLDERVPGPSAPMTLVSGLWDYPDMDPNAEQVMNREFMLDIDHFITTLVAFTVSSVFLIVACTDARLHFFFFFPIADHAFYLKKYLTFANLSIVFLSSGKKIIKGCCGGHAKGVICGRNSLAKSAPRHR